MVSRPKEEYQNHTAINLNDPKMNAKGDSVMDANTDFS